MGVSRQVPSMTRALGDPWGSTAGAPCSPGGTGTTGAGAGSGYVCTPSLAYGVCDVALVYCTNTSVRWHVFPPTCPLVAPRTLRQYAWSSLRLEKHLGAGSFGAVRQMRLPNGTPVAVKANAVDCSNLAAIENERALSERLLLEPHPNVLQARRGSPCLYSLCGGPPLFTGPRGFVSVSTCNRCWEFAWTPRTAKSACLPVCAKREGWIRCWISTSERYGAWHSRASRRGRVPLWVQLAASCYFDGDTRWCVRRVVCPWACCWTLCCKWWAP